ncbi:MULTISPECIES: sugar ABC transporter ATP-binding protein [unclassified Rhizobium]|uniref:sugar ABC transporter ATP-binding protein n=1 Tax=unclassified Rhizobium TaxID=2613769 RepID=UPI00381FA855
MSNLLEMTGITKRFGSVLALDNIDFDLRAGETHALLGINGAGKSTLVKIISGVYSSDDGKILMDGVEVVIREPTDAMESGIATVQQHPELIGSLSGIENIFLGQEGAGKGLLRRVDRELIRMKTQALLARFPIEIDLSIKVENMSSVEREIVAILHALRQDNIKVLILDEPTSTLTLPEARKLFEVMETLKRSGIGIIYITHRLEEVIAIADRFTVFRDGRKIVTGAKDGSVTEESLSKLMLQKELGALYPAKRPKADADGDILLQTRSLGVEGALEDINIELRRGEIVGGFGLVGSGIEVLASALFGDRQLDHGQILVQGAVQTLQTPKDALRRGIFLVPGDRKTQGLTLTKNVTFNATLAHLGRASSRWGGWLRRRQNADTVAGLLERLELRPPHLWRNATEFSGGNQQKIVLAKGLFRQADVYIFLEPTVGVDLGARSKLYDVMRSLSEHAAILVLSSDFDEVCGVADRIFCLYRGRMSIPPSFDLARDEVLDGGLVGRRQ